MPLRPTTRTLGDVKRAVRRSFGDESSVQINDQDLINWANEAQTEIVSKNHNLKAVGTTVSVAGQSDYEFPDQQIDQVEALMYDNVRIQNIEMPTALEDVVSLDPQNEDDTGVPRVWWEWGGKFTLYPTPDEPKTITLYYTKYPDELVTDAQLLSVPNKYFNAVVNYCIWHAYEQDEDWYAARTKEGHFHQALESQAEEERETENLVYPIIQDVEW